MAQGLAFARPLDGTQVATSLCSLRDDFANLGNGLHPESNQAMDGDLTRIRELALNPREELDVELKQWLDLSDKTDRANLAQAILAMANHGGGTVLLGFEEREGKWLECSSAPTKALLTDFRSDTPFIQSAPLDVLTMALRGIADDAELCAAVSTEDMTLDHSETVARVMTRIETRARIAIEVARRMVIEACAS